MLLTEATSILLPKRVNKGDTLGLTAPSSQCNTKSVSNFANAMEKAGYKILLGETVTYLYDTDYNSASAKVRAEDFNKMVKDDNVSVIWCAAGGFGAQGLAEYLDYDAIKKARKPIIGFSDTTFLLNAITQKTGLITFLGPTAEHCDNQHDADSIGYAIKILSGAVNYPHTIQNFDGSIIRKISDSRESVTGKIIGGNLVMLQTTLGTEYEVDTDGKIVLIEEVGESSYSIERTLDHLFTAGKFDNPAAVIFGEFSNIKREPVEKPQDSNPSVHEVIVKKFKNKKYPVLIGYNFSHGTYNLTIPIGSIGKVDGSKRLFRVLENPTK